MTDLHAKGAVNKAKGQVYEGYGKLTGDRREQVKGKIKQVEGSVQDGLGDLQDSARRPARS
jgi:uncharacterized protein YjbJ (UPF0337 family)